MTPAGQPNKRLYQTAVCLSVQPLVSRDRWGQESGPIGARTTGRKGSKCAVPASRRECPLFYKAAVAAARRKDSATSDGAAGFGLLHLDPRIVR
jgi:hypothetical protein